jgi:phosphatidylglycerol:prolipoprotein diacylglycerol transferase
MPYLHQIDPIALSLGPVNIHWYGIMYLFAFAGAYGLGLRRVREGRLPVTEQAFADLAFYAMMGVILGGRIGYMLFYGWSEWLADPLSLLRVWEGGMSFHGGLLGVLGALALWARRQRLPFWDLVDFVAPLVPPGLGLGRLGNFIGGELWGKPTDAAWGVIFPKAVPDVAPDALQALYRAGELGAYARHPTQLYEFALEGVVMFVVLFWFSAKPRPRYAAAGLFALMYGVFRFAVEFLREPDAHIGYLAGGWLTMGMLLSLPLVAIGIFLLGLSRGAPVLLPSPRPVAATAESK